MFEDSDEKGDAKEHEDTDEKMFQDVDSNEKSFDEDSSEKLFDSDVRRTVGSLQNVQEIGSLSTGSRVVLSSKDDEMVMIFYPLNLTFDGTSSIYILPMLQCNYWWVT